MDTGLVVATIHFLGLAMFSTQVPPDEGAMRVLLPRVEQQHKMTMTSSSGGSMEQMVKSVESHVAAVIVKESDLLQEINWESEPVPEHMLEDWAQKTPYRMVRLDGETLTFMPSVDNKPVATTSLVLPKLACSGRVARKPDVVATVNVPTGQLASCKAPSRNRYDTVLTLNTRGVFTLWADKSDTPSRSDVKALVLDGSATVWVVNIPTSVMEGTNEAPSQLSASHFLAYYGLLHMRPGKDCVPRIMPPREPVGECDPIPVNVGAIAFSRVVDSECTNTAWP
ncbi:MAG TPA: hypothetical protein VM733_07280 [Thermoanaerobaculia bacterium]|nr:hypothetical protein [Thermoanaerobaculia bacterium]